MLHVRLTITRSTRDQLEAARTLELAAAEIRQHVRRFEVSTVGTPYVARTSMMYGPSVVGSLVVAFDDSPNATPPQD